jgi:hypothetical protein
MWLVYTAYWWAMSTDVKQTKRREPGLSRFARMVLILRAMALLWLPRHGAACLLWLSRSPRYDRN